MSKINISEILEQMLEAFKKKMLSDYSAMWPQVKTELSGILKAIAQRMVEIEKMVAQKSIGQEEAQTLLTMQKQDAEEQLLTVEGFGKIAIQNSINAALDAIKTIVNDAGLAFNITMETLKTTILEI